MASFVPNRSAKGCLTCKQRKKKCDETKPICIRCTDGEFHCGGYDHLNTVGLLQRKTKAGVVFSSPQNTTPKPSNQAVRLRLAPDSSQALDIAHAVLNELQASDSSGSQHPRARQTYKLYATLSPPDDIEGFIVSRYVLLAQRAFRPFPHSSKATLIKIVQGSKLTRWTMYIGAKTLHSVSHGIEWHDGSGWISRLHYQVIAHPMSLELSSRSVESRLMCCHDLSVYAFVASKTRLGYNLFKHCSPLFLELVNNSSDLHSPGSAISLQSVLCSSSYGICRFAAFDTILSAVFCVPSQIRYDTTYQGTLATQDGSQLIEIVYGWPMDIVLCLGRINAWRISRWMDQSENNSLEWQEVLTQIQSWRPSIQYIDEPSNVIREFAVHEAWRQSALIYLYMGMCMANSADARVEAAVRQVVQLASTIEPGAPLEPHIFIPCLIAGVAARREKDRQILHDKLLSAHGENIWMVSGRDMISVLEHLWGGVGVGGAPTTWEDYVDSRCEVLPLDGTLDT